MSKSGNARSIALTAIVPAAGRSGRMGTPKQLLDIDGRPMLLGVVESLLGGGATHVIVVAHAAVRRDLPLLPAGASFAGNDDPNTQMIDSIRIGLRAAPHADGYLVCPCDVARISAGDVRRCVDAFAEAPELIIIGAHAGRRGHPMIFPAALAAAVYSPECDAGLNHLARHRPQLVREVPCDSPGTVANINTPADYQRLR